MSLAKNDLKVTRREDLEKGGECYVIVYLDANRSIKKKKRAKVIDVLRKGAVLDIEGEQKPRTVRFSELEQIPPPTPTPPPPAPPKKKPKKETPRHLRAVPEAPEPAPSVREERVSEKSPPSLDEWAQQGLALQKQLIRQSHELENQMKALLAEADDLELQAIRKREEAESQKRALAAVRERIAFFDQLRELKG